MEMGTGGYVKPERILFKDRSDLNEKWVQDRISEDPSILGLGDDLTLRDRERSQPGAGRLDLLLEDPKRDPVRRYEVEIQLGATDASHIIRTIEYWDIERKRNQQYEHYAVLVAENVTSRFLNVVSLFNGAIPLIAIQFQALKIGEYTSLVFTTVLGELVRGDEDEESQPPPDRSYWEQRGSKITVSLADQLLEMIREFAPGVEPKYNKRYIGLSQDSRVNNFIALIPQKNLLRLRIFWEESQETDEQLEQETDLTFAYNRHRRSYDIDLNRVDIDRQSDALKKLMRLAYERKAL